MKLSDRRGQKDLLEGMERIRSAERGFSIPPVDHTRVDESSSPLAVATLYLLRRPPPFGRYLLIASGGETVE